MAGAWDEISPPHTSPDRRVPSAPAPVCCRRPPSVIPAHLHANPVSARPPSRRGSMSFLARASSEGVGKGRMARFCCRVASGTSARRDGASGERSAGGAETARDTPACPGRRLAIGCPVRFTGPRVTAPCNGSQSRRGPERILHTPTGMRSPPPPPYFFAFSCRAYDSNRTARRGRATPTATPS